MLTSVTTAHERVKVFRKRFSSTTRSTFKLKKMFTFRKKNDSVISLIIQPHIETSLEFSGFVFAREAVGPPRVTTWFSVNEEQNRNNSYPPQILSLPFCEFKRSTLQCHWLGKKPAKHYPYSALRLSESRSNRSFLFTYFDFRASRPLFFDRRFLKKLSLFYTKLTNAENTYVVWILANL